MKVITSLIVSCGIAASCHTALGLSPTRVLAPEEFGSLLLGSGEIREIRTQVKLPATFQAGSGISVKLAVGTDFVIASSGCEPSMETCQLRLLFEPQTVGPKRDEVLIHNEDACSLVIPLSGTALGPQAFYFPPASSRKNPGETVSVEETIQSTIPVFDVNGDMYYADPEHNVIRRRIAASGNTEIFAGTGEAGFNGDNSAQVTIFNAPSALVFNSLGNLLVADRGNHLVREIDRVSKQVQTLRSFNAVSVLAPQMCAADPSSLASYQHTVYVTDSCRNAIIALEPEDTARVVAGNGTEAGTDGIGNEAAATGATLLRPSFVTVRIDGRVVFVDAGHRQIREIKIDGNIARVWQYEPVVSPRSLLALAGQLLLLDGQSHSLVVLEASRVRSLRTKMASATSVAFHPTLGVYGCGPNCTQSEQLGVPLTDEQLSGYLKTVPNRVVFTPGVRSLSQPSRRSIPSGTELSIVTKQIRSAQGTRSTGADVTLTNIGDEPIPFIGLSAIIAEDIAPTLSASCNAVLQAGERCSISIHLRPGAFLSPIDSLTLMSKSTLVVRIGG